MGVRSREGVDLASPCAHCLRAGYPCGREALPVAACCLTILTDVGKAIMQLRCLRHIPLVPWCSFYEDLPEK